MGFRAKNMQLVFGRAKSGLFWPQKRPKKGTVTGSMFMVVVLCGFFVICGVFPGTVWTPSAGSLFGFGWGRWAVGDDFLESRRQHEKNTTI